MWPWRDAIQEDGKLGRRFASESLSSINNKAPARAVAEQRRATNELAATRSELVERALAMRSRVEQTFAEVRQLVDVVMPLRKRVLEQTVLQYNAMNASTFELLVARRDMVDVGRQYIEALRSYWSAKAEAKALRRGGRAMLTKEQMR